MIFGQPKKNWNILTSVDGSSQKRMMDCGIIENMAEKQGSV